METKQKERIRRLMELLKKTDRIHLKDAARMLEVSVMTIRRDLSQDDDPLPLTLLGGYIVMVNKPASSNQYAAAGEKDASSGRPSRCDPGRRTGA
ncbi:transcriptional regulator [Salmonella enterica subsp. enterica]|uniref:Transcriptional regulator n=1 Tax=Salmonella enterica I TaxID=59201 RepID=A0A379WJ70_SALET|nr:transcriptional regulator [Salmonella enterica subsp. enterica]